MTAAIAATAALLAAAATAQVCSTPRDYFPEQSAQIKAIYGPDSRQDEADTSECWRAIGRSTVVRLHTLYHGHPCPSFWQGPEFTPGIARLSLLCRRANEVEASWQRAGCFSPTCHFSRSADWCG